MKETRIICSICGADVFSFENEEKQYSAIIPCKTCLDNAFEKGVAFARVSQHKAVEPKNEKGLTIA